MARRSAKYGRLGPLYDFIPRRVYLAARNLWLDAKSIPQRLGANAPGPLPWMTLHNYGGPAFYESGERLAGVVRDKLGISPSANVLDIGCGSGRIAWPLAAYLNADGAYIGFDVSKHAIAFGRRLLRDQRPDFQFHHADLYSKEYNPGAPQKARDYRFPCDDGWADAALAVSLFTHLLEEDASRFLQELARALKPDGRAYVTAFVLNDEVAERMAAKTASLTMQRYRGPVWAGDLATPEAAVGYDEPYFLGMVADAGLEVDGDIARGAWSLPTGHVYGQDVFVLRRAALE